MNFVCPHSPFQCIQVSHRKYTRCITNFNYLSTVDDIVHLFTDDLSENEFLSINDCCVYLDKSPYLFPLKSTDFISDIVSHYSVSTIRLKLTVKRSSPSCVAQRKIIAQSSTSTDPYEQIRLQEALIQKQQELIHQLTKFDTNRPLAIPKSTSQVRFRLSTATVTNQKHDSPAKPTTEMKSILKKSSSIDRDIDQLMALNIDDDDDDDDNQSTTDSCLGSLSSVDSGCYSLTRQQLETLV